MDELYARNISKGKEIVLPSNNRYVQFKEAGRLGEAAGDYTISVLADRLQDGPEELREFNNTSDKHYSLLNDEVDDLFPGVAEDYLETWKQIKGQHATPARLHEWIGDMYEFAYFYFVSHYKFNLALAVCLSVMKHTHGKTKSGTSW